jgi:hypothetical protein
MLQYNTSIRCVCFEDYEASINTSIDASENNIADENGITVRHFLKSIQSTVLQRLYFVAKRGWVTGDVSPARQAAWST